MSQGVLNGLRLWSSESLGKRSAQSSRCCKQILGEKQETCVRLGLFSVFELPNYTWDRTSWQGGLGTGVWEGSQGCKCHPVCGGGGGKCRGTGKGGGNLPRNTLHSIAEFISIDMNLQPDSGTSSWQDFSLCLRVKFYKDQSGLLHY